MKKKKEGVRQIPISWFITVIVLAVVLSVIISLLIISYFGVGVIDTSVDSGKIVLQVDPTEKKIGKIFVDIQSVEEDNKEVIN